MARKFLVDPEDEALAAKARIHGEGSRYESVMLDDGRILSRVLLGVTDSFILVDHKNGDSLDCRKNNLRIVSYSENAHNRKKYKLKRHDLPHGIEQLPNGKYRARITFEGSRFYSPSVWRLTDAIKWWEEQATQWFGDKARHLHRS